MQRRETAKPRWVIVVGELREASAFVGLPPARRPPARCPMCDEPVTLKLGEERAPHYAHRPDSTCPATRPETALHLNVKFYLALQ